MGICLGMQLLTYFSAENGKNNGLRIIPGQIKENFKRSHHIGWNDIRVKKIQSLLILTKNIFIFNMAFLTLGLRSIRYPPQNL